MIGTLSNIAAMLSLSAMNRHAQAMNTSMERLATGKRINRASDDPSGMMIAEPMEVELRSITKEIDRGLFEEKRYGAMEGAQSVIADLLQELNGLVVNSANRGAVGRGEREANQQEADSILRTIDHLAATTTFNGEKVIEYLTAKGLGLDGLANGGELDLVDGDPEKAQDAVQAAIDRMSGQQAGLGIAVKAIESNIRVLRDRFENVSAVKSQIVDTDYAAETATMIREQVLREAATFVAKLAMQQTKTLIGALLSGDIESRH
jgi:flagellin